MVAEAGEGHPIGVRVIIKENVPASVIRAVIARYWCGIASQPMGPSNVCDPGTRKVEQPRVAVRPRTAACHRSSHRDLWDQASFALLHECSALRIFSGRALLSLVNKTVLLGVAVTAFSNSSCRIHATPF